MKKKASGKKVVVKKRRPATEQRHGQRPQVRIKDVENPRFLPDHPDDTTNPRIIAATVNLRESTIEYLSARGVIEPYQKQAADKFRRLWEMMGGSGASAIDFSKDVISGSVATGFSEAKLIAFDELRAARMKVGERGYHLLVAVCSHGMTFSKMFKTINERKAASQMLSMHLHDLAEMWGLIRNARNERSRIRSHQIGA